MLLTSVPFLVILYFIGKKLRGNGQKPTIRQTAGLVSLTLAASVFGWSLLTGDSVIVAALVGAVFLVVGATGILLFLVGLNTVRGKDDSRYLRW